MRKTKYLIVALLAVFMITTGFGCRWSINRPAGYPKVTLEYWGVWDTPGQMEDLIKAYEQSHPTITVNYRNLRYDEYERKLLEAWADDRGPDIFAIPASWLREYQRRIVAMPSSIKVPIAEVRTGIKEEVIVVEKTFSGLSPNDVRRTYVPVVAENVVLDNQVYGLPYSMDTLVTFYNSDLLTRANIPTPIQDFNDLVDQAPKLTRAAQGNDIVQSAAALGGTSNIPRFFDIFSSIMLQNQVEAKGDRFSPLTNADSKTRLSQAFSFYTDFARPGRASYSWNEDLPDAFEMFASGQLAYFFGYSYHADQLRERNVQFDWDITNFPQTRGAQGTKYYADYWVNVVSKKSKNGAAAWNFIQSTASESLVKVYLDKNKRPTALRNLINSQLQDEQLRVFTSQSLTADNWYAGYDQVLAEQYLKEIIDGLVSGEMILDQSDVTLRLFVDRINQTYKQPDE